MSFIRSVFSNPYKPSKIHSMKKNEFYAGTDCQILKALKPVVAVCRIFGIFPFIYSSPDPAGNVHLRSSKVWWWYSFIVLLVTTAYMLFELVSFALCVRNTPVIQLAAHSLWILCPLPAYLASIFMLIWGKDVLQLVMDWCTIEFELDRLFCPLVTRGHIRRFQQIYSGIGIISTLLCGYHALMRPESPVYIFYFLKKGTYNEGHHIAYVIFQMIMIAWLWAGLVVLEGICCLFSTVIDQCLTTMISGLEFTFDKTNKQSSDEIAQIELDAEHRNHEQYMRASVHYILQRNAGSKKIKPITNGENENEAKPVESAPILKNDYIMFVIHKVQTVGNLQSKINKTIGPLILINVGQLVIITCILFFIPIRYPHKVDGFEGVVTFLGNGFVALVRFVVFIVSLGSVYSKGQEMNLALTRAMTSNLEVSQPAVLAHLITFASNPITFTAYGFFSINRGTLLAAFSLISTYAMVFFQINFSD